MEKIKEIWNNGKYRGLIFLGFYFLLFTYIFFVYGGENNDLILPEKTPIKEEAENEIITSYEYEYVIDDQIINVIKYNDIVNFSLNEINYYYIDSKTYKLENETFYETENPLEYNFDYIGQLEEIKKLSTLIKTTTFADQTIEENYDVNFATLLGLFGITEAVGASETLNYSIFYKDNQITKISFLSLNLEINYINYENIEEININYEFYKEEVSEWV